MAQSTMPRTARERGSEATEERDADTTAEGEATYEDTGASATDAPTGEEVEAEVKERA